MNTKQLRQKILDMAIKGKLVPQDPNDEPACKLLERIREEKEQLIKEGKLKRDKNESYIFVGADKLHYEKFADGSVVCIEDEIPFEIPDSWRWCKVDNVSTIKGGKRLPSGRSLLNDKTNHPYLRIVDMKNNTIIDDDIHYISEDVFAKIKQYIITDKDLYITIAGTIGNVGIIPSKYNNANLTENAVRVTPLLINKKYLMYLILSNYVQNQFIDKTHHVAMPKLAIERIKGVLIPIPPIQEQNRIVETVGTLLQLVETIDSDKIDLSNLIKQTKAKVLDLAIKGKLVPQDDNDEPADKLLEKIREEKEKLIKEGKIKRDKNETFIFKSSDDNSYYEQIGGETVCIDDDLPFEIPNTWRWCRLSNICSYIQRGKSPKYSEIKKYPVISQKCVRWTGLDLQPAKYITEDSLQKYENIRFLCDNDILWNSTGTGTVGRAAIYNKKLNLFSLAVADSHVTVIRPMNVLSSYIHYFIMSPHVQVGFEDLCDGSTNQKELSLTTVSDFLIPLPPYKEQLRITEKTNEIFSYLDNLETIIKGS